MSSNFFTIGGESNPAATGYRLAGSPDWEAFLRHFDLSSAFAILVVLPPDRFGAEVCRSALAGKLAYAGKSLLEIPIHTPADLLSLASGLLELQVPPATAAIWVSAAVPEGLADYAAWRTAWVSAAAQLNQIRERLRKNLPCALVLAGAPWLREVLRVVAPDLWSILSQMVIVEADVRPGAGEELSIQPVSEARSAPDPEFALQEAAKLRDHAGMEAALAATLLRAAHWFGRSRQWPEALQAAQEAVALCRHLNESRPGDFDFYLAGSLSSLGIVLKELGRDDEAATAARDAVATHRRLLTAKPPLIPSGLAVALSNYGIILLSLGRIDDAEAAVREGLAIPTRTRSGRFGTVLGRSR